MWSPSVPIPEEPPAMLNVNREWRWGDGAGSAVTLPEESDEGPYVWEWRVRGQQ